MGRVKRIWYLSPMRAAKVQASLRIRAVSPEPPLLAHTSSESRGTFKQNARSLALLNGWAYAVKICHDGMLEDTNSLDAAHIFLAVRSTGRAIAVTTALPLHKMLEFLVKVFKSLCLLNLWMDLVDIVPDVRYWSEVLCCTILTHISDLEVKVKVTSFEILCLSFWLKFLEVFIFWSYSGSCWYFAWY